MISNIKLFEKSIYKNKLIINLSNRLLSTTIEVDNNNNNKKKLKKSKKQLDNNEDILPFNSDAIISLCKRKGFVYQSSEIYSPLAGFFDYGPLGVELKNNLKSLWWKEFVKRKENIVGIDSSIISSSSIWNASGHISGFSDPMVDCKSSKLRFRADQVFWGKLETINDDELCYISILESDNMLEIATKAAIKKSKKINPTMIGPFKPLKLTDLTQANSEIYHKIPSPVTGEANQLTTPRDFNLM
jgi:glycyl-tRNA synthetase